MSFFLLMGFLFLCFVFVLRVLIWGMGVGRVGCLFGLVFCRGAIGGEGMLSGIF